MKKKPIYTIAVTGLNAIDSPGPGMAVVRALLDAKSFDVRIIGLSYETLEPGIYMKDLVDKTYQIPFPSAGKAALKERLSYIHSIEKLDIIFPNFDAELYSFIKLKDELKSLWDIKMVLPSIEQFDARHKVNLYEYGLVHGIKVPYARMIYSHVEIPALAGEFGYPLAVKGKYYDASAAYTPEDVRKHFNKISAQWGLPIIIQKFVLGSEVNVCGIGDGKGNLLGAVPMRKLFVTDKGKAWAGVTLDDAKLLRITKKWMKSSKWSGPFELEFIKTVENEYYLLEINPRFPAWIYLCIGAGQNQVESMVHVANGEKVKPFTKYEIGKMFIRYSEDMIVDMKDFEKISTVGEL